MESLERKDPQETMEPREMLVRTELLEMSDQEVQLVFKDNTDHQDLQE